MTTTTTAPAVTTPWHLTTPAQPVPRCRCTPLDREQMPDGMHVRTCRPETED